MFDPFQAYEDGGPARKFYLRYRPDRAEELRELFDKHDGLGLAESKFMAMIMTAFDAGCRHARKHRRKPKVPRPTD